MVALPVTVTLSGFRSSRRAPLLRGWRGLRRPSVRPRFVQLALDPLEEHRVDGHDDGGDRHQQGRELGPEHDAVGREEHPGRNRDGEHVVDRGPHQVLLHLPHGGLREHHGARDVQGIALHQDHFRRLDGDVCSRADGDPYVGLRQRRGVVNPVSDHRHALALSLQLLHVACFVCWQYLGEDALYPKFARYGFGGSLVVARDHDRLYAHLLEAPQCLSRARFDRIRHGNDPGGSSVDRDEHRRLARLCECGGLLFKLVDVNPVLVHKLEVAHPHDVSIHRGTYAAAGYGLEARGVAGLDTHLAGTSNYRFCERVLGVLLSRGHEAQKIILAPAVNGRYVGEGGLALRESARLVEHNGIGARDVLKGRRVLDQDVVPRPDARADG